MSSNTYQIFRADGSPIVGAIFSRDQKSSKPMFTVNTLRYTEPERPSRLSRRGLPCPDDRTGEHPWIRVGQVKHKRRNQAYD
jgi:hypothetical protein